MGTKKTTGADRPRVGYLHTICGKPALYWPGEQICYTRTKVRPLPPIATSLRQIRREQQATIAWRKAQGFLTDPRDYDYVLLVLP